MTQHIVIEIGGNGGPLIAVEIIEGREKKIMRGLES